MNSFERGLHTQFDPVFQPKGSYRDLTNAVRDLSGTIYSENGTVETIILPTGLKLVGKILVDQTLVLFSSDFEARSSNFELGVRPEGPPQTDIGTPPSTGIGVNPGISVPEIEEPSVSEIAVYENSVYVPYVSNRIGANAKLQLTRDFFKFGPNNLVSGTGRRNYNNNLIIYFSDGNGTARTINLSKVETENISTFDEDSKLFISRLIPVVTYKSVIDGGECLSGVYQFAARYVSNSGNTSPFGFITNPISITDDFENSNVSEYDGCLPQTQTSKAINMEISHLDTDYPFIEIGMQTYVGLQNTPTYKIVARIPNNKPTLTYRFTGKEDRGSITKDEFIQEGASYSFVSFYQQKNNHLLIAGLYTKNENYGFDKLAEEIDIKFKAVFTAANQNRIFAAASGMPTVIGVTSDTIDLKKQLLGRDNSYKSAIFAADNKCYMPDEVYSFAFVPIFKDGTYGFAYPILAKESLPETEDDFIQNLVDGKQNELLDPVTGIGNLLKYTSQETYGEDGIRIRHFRFPPKRYFANFKTAETENTHLDTVGFDDLYKGATVPNPARHNVVYGIHLSNINFTEEQKTVLQGYVIVRQKRDIFQNKSVLAQGFARQFSKNNAENITIWDIPILGTTQIENNPPNSEGDSDRMIATNTITGLLTSPVIGDYCKFYSPDIFHNAETGELAKQICFGGDLKMSLGHATKSASGSIDKDMFFASLENTTYTNDATYNEGFSDFIEDRRNLGNATLAEEFKNENPVRNINDFLNKGVSADPYYDTNSFWRPSGLDYQSFGDQSKTIIYKLDGRLKKTIQKQKVAGPSFGAIKLRRDGPNNVTDFSSSAGTSDDLFSKRLKLSTHYIKTKNDLQYGKLEEAEYVQIGHSFNLEQSSISIMGGDCYFTYYWMNFLENLVFTGYNRTMFTLVQLPIISEQNYNLRHYEEAGSGQTTQDSEGTQPYYPKENRILNNTTSGRIGLANLEIKNGVSSGYNKQYGFENITKSFFGKPFLFEDVINFSNRVAYSEQLIEGEQIDAFRIFKQNNYQDISKQFGVITDLFVFNEVLYAHCENALFQLSFLQQSTMVTSAGEVELGDGKKLQSAPRLIYDINGGYAGTTTRWANVNTPFGRFFIDTNQKKVFLLSDGIKEVSDLGMKRLFFDNLERKQNSYYSRYIGTYDYENDRYLVFDTDQNRQFGYSFFTKAESWLSRHTWKPEDIFYFDGKLLSFSGNSIYAHSDNNNSLRIYGNNEPFSIIIIENEQIVQTKRYDNVILYCEFFRNDGQSGIEKTSELPIIYNPNLDKTEKGLSYLNFFDELSISNDNHLVNKPFTFSVKDVNSVLVRRKSSEYRFAVPRNTNPEKVKQRITGKFAIFGLSKTSLNGDSVKLHWIDITSTPYIR